MDHKENFKKILESAQVSRTKKNDIVSIKESTESFVVVKIKNHYYAFEQQYVKFINSNPVIAYVPGMPSYIAGIAYFNGNVESVIDIANILNKEHFLSKGQAVITKIENNYSAVLVEKIENIVDININNISQTSQGIKEKNKYFKSEFDYKDKNVLVVDLAIMFKDIFKNAPVKTG